MKYYLIAGEASGDLHGSNLIRELRRLDPDAQLRCWGGDAMKAAGGEIVKHYRDLAFMGFIEVVRNLPTILRNLSFCKQDVLAYAPDVLVLIDYPGFNLRIAKWAKARGIKVIYYISPQVWAWKEGRTKTIREVVDRMLVILPFEEAFYQKWDYKVVYVGHPLVQVVDDFRKANAQGSPSQPLIALLPGSRKQEVLAKLPLMLEASRHLPHYRFVVAKAPSLDDAFYASLLAPYPQVETVKNETYALLSQATAALVTSGTATLETALFEVPQVVCYKGSPISYAIARRLIKIKYISLVNLIMDRPVVKELIQHALTVPNLIRELKSLLPGGEGREPQLAHYRELKTLLKQQEDASARAAQEIVGFLQASAESA
jgi:lipid-A-disaccharide synthase